MPTCSLLSELVTGGRNVEEVSPDKTKETYRLQAEAYDRQRSRTFFEAQWLARFGDALPRGGKVLDLGCGGGQPVSAWLIAEGFRFTGVDYSAAIPARLFSC